MAYTARFNFTGELIIPKKNPDDFVKVWEDTSNNTEFAKARFGIKESSTNSCFVECFGTTYDLIKTTDKDKNKIEVSWNERLNKDVIKKVADYRKYVVDLGELTDGKQEFLTQYDFINCLKEYLPKYEGKVFCSGRFKKEPYKGEVYDKYEVDRVEATTAEKNELKIAIDLFYNRDCVDLSEYDDKKRITVVGYMPQYMGKDEGEKFFPQKVVLDVSKFNDSEQHQKYVKMMIDKVNINDKEVMHIPWDCKLIRGAETIAFTEDDLTNAQKEQIACGVATLETFARTTLGENVYEIRFIRQRLMGDFSNGAIDSGFTLNDIEDALYTQPVAKESLEDINNAVEDSSVAETLEDLLG